MRTVKLSPNPYRVFAEMTFGHLIVTPNARAAKTLSVQAVSIDDLATTLLETCDKRVATEVVATSCLQNALSEVLRPNDLEGTTRQLAPVVRELLRTGVPLQKLGESGSAQGALLSAVATRYQEHLRSRGFIDEATKLWVATDSVREPLRLLVVGYPRVGRADLHFLDKIAADGSVLILPHSEVDLFQENREAARFLETRGWTVQETDETPETLGEELSRSYHSVTKPPGEVKATVYPDLESEVRDVLGRAKALVAGGVLYEDIVLVARREAAYGPTLDAVAQEYGLPLRLSYPVPLVETRIGAFLHLCSEVVSTGFPFEGTSHLLKHPLATGLAAEVWTAARKLHPQSKEAWASVGADLSSLSWPIRASRATYVNLLESTAAPAEETASARDQLAIHTLKRVLLEAPGDEPLLLNGFLKELRAALTQLSVPYLPGGTGVALHTPLALFGSRYKYVFALGLAEGVFPAALADPPFLDFYERKALARQGFSIETANARANRERLSIWALLQVPTKHLSLSYARLSQGQVQVKGSVFGELGLEPTPPASGVVASLEEARQRLLFDEQYFDLTVEAARHAHAVELRREGHKPHDEYDGRLGYSLKVEDFVLSATQLTRLGQCPFRWFVGQLLKVRELEEAEDNLGPTLRGKLYHKALELAVKASRDAEDLRRAVLEALPDAFSEAEREELPAIANWAKRRAEHLRHLERAVRDDDFITPGHRVVAVEERFETYWHGLKVTGVVDRVDQGPEGNFVKDYKTSSSKPAGAKDSNDYAKVDVQLPLYLHATRTEILPDQPLAGGHYYSLTKREKRVLASASADDGSPAALAAQVKTYFEDGFFPVEPDVQLKACAYCEFSGVCRKGPRLERKRRRHADA